MSQHPDRPGLPEAPISTDISSQGKDLAERLEALQPGHPSSPYNSDRSPKPPVPHPRERERPIPGDPDYEPLEASADQNLPPSDAEDGHQSESQPDGTDSDAKTADAGLPRDEDPVIGEDGSWGWKGRHLSPEQSRIADQALARCRAAEGRDADGKYRDQGLTPAMRRIEAELDDGRLVDGTEEFALKSADRFKEKLADRLTLRPGVPAQELAAGIHDGVRYTFLYEGEHYTNGFWQTESSLRSQGYDLLIRKPNWDGLDYKGLNSQWRDPDSGLIFEVQYHTPASWDAKQKTHAAYEKIADPRTSSLEREELDRYQREVTASVPIPQGADGIPYYRKGAI